MVAQVNADSVAAIMLDRNAMRTSKKRGNILAATMPLTANRLKLTSGLLQSGIKRSATPTKMPTGRNTKNRKKRKFIVARHGIVPLCHSDKGSRGGCNNSKHNRDAVKWLVERHGQAQAAEIIQRVEAYFADIR